MRTRAERGRGGGGTGLTAGPRRLASQLFATGSRNSFVRIAPAEADAGAHVIRYHDGFLGTRMGPVSSLAFNAAREDAVLAAGATDGVIAVYGCGTSRVDA